MTEESDQILQGQTSCESCGWDVFGLDDRGYFCFNCGAIQDDPGDAEIRDFRSPEVIAAMEPQEEEPTTIPIREEISAMKKVSTKKNSNKKAVKKKVVKKKAAVKKKTSAKTSQNGKAAGYRNGTSRIEGEKRGEFTLFVNALMEKNLKAQKSGRLGNVKTDDELAETIMKKYPGRNYQAISSYRTYFNGGRHGFGIDGEQPSEPLRSKAALQREKNKNL